MHRILLLLALLAASSAREVGRLAQANNHMGVNVFMALPSSPRQNVFFSPYSISVAMGMVYAGADGETLNQLHHSLGFDAAGLSRQEVLNGYGKQTRANKQLPPEYVLKVANAALVQKNYTVLPEYRSTLASDFDAQVVEADFFLEGEQTKDNINRWIANKTDGKIPTLFEEPLDVDTRLVLLNAVYFKGTWKTRFNKTKTKSRPFYNGGVNKVMVDTMRLKAKLNYVYDATLSAHVVELPYIGDDYSLVIFLPLDRKGVERMKSFLTTDAYYSAISQMTELEVKLKLPKLKLDLKYSLKSPLRVAGIEKVFGSEADLSRIDGSRNLFVSDVLHRAIFELNEEGSVAAAVSGVEVQMRMAVVHQQPPKVYVDHPFLFLIRNTKTNGIAFLGQINTL
uniref:Putative serine protease inhibitor 15 rms15 n=1 Tax=Ornithodoros turicata TaxID=34597 RepID=A0A2R5LAV5_9ACAR